MAMMTREMKKTIHENLKPVFAKYGLKGTLRMEGTTGIVLTLREGMSFYPLETSHYYLPFQPEIHTKYYSGKAKSCLRAITKAMRSAGWYERIRGEWALGATETYETAYYITIQIGEPKSEGPPYRVVE